MQLTFIQKLQKAGSSGTVCPPVDMDEQTSQFSTFGGIFIQIASYVFAYMKE